MQKEKFQFLKTVEERIFQLKIMQQYLQSIIDKSVFAMTFKIGVLGFETERFRDDIASSNKKLFKEDGAYVIGSIQKRIDELEKEFE